MPNLSSLSSAVFTPTALSHASSSAFSESTSITNMSCFCASLIILPEQMYDLPIDYPGLVNNHFVGPDMIFFHKEEPLFEDGFLKWCTKHSIDPFEPKNGILNYPIGTFETLCAEQNFSSQSKITAYDLIDK